MRLDQYLALHHGLTRNKAQQLITIGLVCVNAKICDRASFQVLQNAMVTITADRRVEWVSRSAEKLAGFIEELDRVSYISVIPPEYSGGIQSENGISHIAGSWNKPGMTESKKFTIAGTNCLDIGSSTGGFTQVLLQFGAIHVDAVDVGTDQLHPSLRSDSRVTSYEQTDIRDFAKPPGESFEFATFRRRVIPKEGMSHSDRGIGVSKSQSSVTSGQLLSQGAPKYDVIVCDVSFIGLSMIIDAILTFSSIDTTIILLYKPQFEVGQVNLKKTGIPKDMKIVEAKMEEFEKMLIIKSMNTLKKEKSSLIGEAGNQEWIYMIQKNPESI